ncbi:type 2 lanthipeptide synthetase LanM family protein [Kitasatospora purpeofusca]|uniref:type 2 lanthipeptide synthetase LanM family protein n=1 Tax=Kitasatospora purpeofusca TaxID=67352 RepID=UPI002259EE7F|nr:type 2 lanthipeptide synthetase LanM family protein [Kitasatospora purpeofusca]MCX4759159.1 type 2 lanthipeptide synthetase LanM family protein [Kitasatospora purpeofusca]WSR30433.1 type 2 lanthipeptide synthetase LanM family protein [Kitasatospora purpeofusca]
MPGDFPALPALPALPAPPAAPAPTAEAAETAAPDPNQNQNQNQNHPSQTPRSHHARLRSPRAGGPPWWERGLTPGRPAPATRPDWAAFTEAAVAAAPVRPVVPRAAYPGLSGFALVLQPFADRARVRLLTALTPAVRTADQLGRIDLTALRAEFTARLTERLARIAARTLVLELNTARAAGRLAGGTPQERFRSFLALTARREGLAALLRDYPVLARLLARACLDAADAHAELLDRFAADRALLVSGLLRGRDPGTLLAVTADAGDRHRRGRAVAVLHFANGTAVVHRPRPPAAHRHFNALLGWYGAQPGVPRLRALGLLDRGTHGWTEYAEARPCLTRYDVERFYRRQGALLALLHVLDGTDTHFENLVACGDHPVLVDVETLFHPPAGEPRPVPVPDTASGPGTGTGTGTPEEDPAARALAESVHRVGLLPQLLIGDDGAADVSGIGGGGTGRRLSPVDGVDWAGAGTDEMRLVRRPRPFGAAHNRPRLGGAEVEPAEHTEALVAGFRAGYAALAAGRDDLTGPRGLLRSFADAEVRVVARATRVYARLLDESTHPDVLREAGARQAVLDLLRTDAVDDPGRPGLADHEIADLWTGDVPLFTTRPGTRDLWTSGGRRLPGELAEPGLARVEAKLAALGAVDRKDQEWIVRAAMAGAADTPAHRPGRPVPENVWATAPEPERLLAAARGLGDQLVAAAYQGRSRTNWLGLELLADRHWRVRPLGADLAGGYTGTALFLAQLAALTGTDRYAEAARRALAPVPGLLDALGSHPGHPAAVGSGAFAGLGGISYALAELARLLDDPPIAGWAGAAVALTLAAAEGEADPGVHSGTAGGLAALLAVQAGAVHAGAVHAGTQAATEARAAAARCAELLAAHPLPATAGFAHGSAGVGWALLRYAEATAEPPEGPYHRAGLAALRAATAVRSREGSWCRGRPGIALAVLDSPLALADRELADWAQRAVRNTARATPLGDHSLCHGELGVLELLGRHGPAAGRTPWVRRAGALLAAVDQDGARSGTPDHVPHPGLLTGLAGIGHGLLRLGFPEQVPSALLLRPRAPAASGPAPATAPAPGSAAAAHRAARPFGTALPDPPAVPATAASLRVVGGPRSPVALR